ncbi:hypothetical protein EE612_031330 [Oryza sativa]|nr:hypothetical protein EE612_031330 [Oryza sativa]
MARRDGHHARRDGLQV